VDSSCLQREKEKEHPAMKPGAHDAKPRWR
jgi:hypothetical protein